MIKYFKVLAIFALFTISAKAENVGWHSYLKENPTEFHDILLNWESGDQTNVPDWLSGVFVRNGPAQVSKQIFLDMGSIYWIEFSYNSTHLDHQKDI